jgi:hypothetical protein
MANGGPARQPGRPEKRALFTEEGGQQGEAAKKQYTVTVTVTVTAGNP